MRHPPSAFLPTSVGALALVLSLAVAVSASADPQTNKRTENTRTAAKRTATKRTATTTTRAATATKSAKSAQTFKASSVRRIRGTRVAVKLPTKAIRGRIAKPQVMLYVARRTPVFRPWINGSKAVYDRRNQPRRSLYR